MTDEDGNQNAIKYIKGTPHVKWRSISNGRQIFRHTHTHIYKSEREKEQT